MTKTPWKEFSHIWATESSFMSFLRGGIRRSLWSRSPIKLEFLKKYKKKIVNPNPRGKVKDVFGATCEICNKDFPMKDIEVDHRKGGHSLRQLSDLQAFIEGIVCVTFDDLAILCKPCHKAKTLAEKNGTSIEEAIVEKKVIQIMKDKQDKQFLIDNGVVPKGNAKLRRIQLKEILNAK